MQDIGLLSLEMELKENLNRVYKILQGIEKLNKESHITNGRTRTIRLVETTKSIVKHLDMLLQRKVEWLEAESTQVLKSKDKVNSYWLIKSETKV